MVSFRGEYAGTSYTLDSHPGRLHLQVLSPGSPAGGSGSESQLDVDGAAYTALLAELRLAETELDAYLSSLQGEQWREFWHRVSVHATSRFTWFDTAW